ncbi:MAG: glycosyltransferase family protein [Alphaproteobacteria bacterium]|nr:glycosyltransferase family protein [Alphaproteobacteria bacterium]
MTGPPTLDDRAQQEIDRAIAAANAFAADGRPSDGLDALFPLIDRYPEHPALLFAVGRLAQGAGLLEQAEAAYRGVLRLLPSSVEAATNLANVMVARDEVAPALAILQRIHDLAPTVAPVTASLAAARLAEGDAEEALRLYERLIDRDPSDARHHANRAEALARLDRHADSLAALDRAATLAPDDPDIGFNRSIALLTSGRVEEGFAAYETRLTPALATAPHREGLTLPRWAGAPLTGPLLVVAEQGLGDEIRFAAGLTALREAGVEDIVVEIEPRLVTLLARGLPWATVRPHDRRTEGGRRPVFRYRWLDRLPHPPVAWIEAGSLPLRLGAARTRPMAPLGVLAADPGQITRVEPLLPPAAPGQLRIGLVWSSGVTTHARRPFYPPLEAFGPLLTARDIVTVDLQYTDSHTDRARFQELFGAAPAPVEGLDKRGDLDGLAALMTRLDAVVAISGSTAALAAALGVPTIELHRGETWIPRLDDRDYWLGSLRPIAPDSPGDWPAVMHRCLDTLRRITRHQPPA